MKAISEILKQKIMKEGKPFYDVWMLEISDNIQNTALAYAESFILLSAMQNLKTIHPDGKDALSKIIRLHCLYFVK